jgi:hypothetical protein
LGEVVVGNLDDIYVEVNIYWHLSYVNAIAKMKNNFEVNLM